MPENQYYPEGLCPLASYSLSALKTAMENQTILEGLVLCCDAEHRLHVSLGTLSGIIPREEAISPAISGSAREIALLSRVGKPVCFVVTSVAADDKGKPLLLLSRKKAQEEALHFFLNTLKPGMVHRARVTHLESFGAFVDIGCGVISLLPIENISVSRVSHPADRLLVGQKLPVVIAGVDPVLQRFHLTHKELLGTWLENASAYRVGETVRGIVRSVQPYGVFVELTPNLSGLADSHPGVAAGDYVSVFLKNIQPERMKVKLQIIEVLGRSQPAPPIRYQITDGQLERWIYSPAGYGKPAVETDFTNP
ncbi:MAG: S1 RNA-binding domain-containing protein [Oscillospiraceae bacterium]